jgi:abortive infection bacteriophage resistance protein
LSASAREFLSRTNFHYFLGYARNFRKLREQGMVESDESIDSPAKMADSDRLDAMRKFPIWSVVDGWTFGALGRVITEAAPRVSDPDHWLWKDIAASFEVANPIFQTQLSSVILLRNLVAHHSRLWMRPTTLTPKAPKLYQTRARACEPKSMYVAWLALASFLKAGGGDQDLLGDIDELVGKDPLYEIGVMRPLSSAD